MVIMCPSSIRTANNFMKLNVVDSKRPECWTLQTHFSEHANNWDAAKVHRVLGVDTLNKIEVVLHLCCQ